MLLTKADLQKVLRYDPDTGIFTRQISTSANARKGDAAGSADKDGYLVISIDHKPYRAHRLAFLYMTGSFPADQTDHINHDRSDNRWANLRPVTRAENARNVTLPKNNSSGFSGVHWRGDTGKWRAYINKAGKREYLGYFKDLSDAVKSRLDAEIKHDFHPNHGV
jgi:hypothetical protein